MTVYLCRSDTGKNVPPVFMYRSETVLLYRPKKLFYLSIKKKIKKVEFCFDPYEALFKRFLKSDEKMAFGTNGLNCKKIKKIG